MMRAMTCKCVIDNIPPSDLISGIVLPTCISVAVPSVFLGTNLVFHLSYIKVKYQLECENVDEYAAPSHGL